LPRFDTTLEAAGAEHLVIGRLLIERIQAFRAHANQPGYDLVAADPESGRSVKIQVKSRVAVDSGAFKLKSFDFDFVVFVRLNRGTKASLKAGQPEGILEPEFFIVPKSALMALGNELPLRLSRSTISKSEYRDNWSGIKDALKTKTDLRN
jgi:hypothetical protein